MKVTKRLISCLTKFLRDLDKEGLQYGLISGCWFFRGEERLCFVVRNFLLLEQCRASKVVLVIGYGERCRICDPEERISPPRGPRTPFSSSRAPDSLSTHLRINSLTSGKESACQCRKHRRCKRSKFNPWVGKIPQRRKQQSTVVFLPEKFHGQRSLAGYCSWGHEESDSTGHTHGAM